MKISAFIDSKKSDHIVQLKSNGVVKALNIESGNNGFGSAINGGEFLFLAIATCFCNDIYREAKKKGILIHKVQVEASGEFLAEGSPGENIRYKANIVADASSEEIKQLMLDTDKLSEIHNTLRRGVEVKLEVNH